MKYICLVYHDANKLEAMSLEELADHIGKCKEWVGELEASGRHIFSSGLQSPRTASTLQLRNGSLSVTDGPFAETKEFFGGFTILEATDFNDALQWASKLDVVRIGKVEVRPLLGPDLALSDPLDHKLMTAFRSTM